MSREDKSFSTRQKKAIEAEQRFIKQYKSEGWYIYEYGIHMAEKDNNKFWKLPKIIQKTPDFICWKPDNIKKPIFVEHKQLGGDWLALKPAQHQEYKRWNNLMPLYYAIEVVTYTPNGRQYETFFADWECMEKLAQQSLTDNDGNMQPFPLETDGSKVHYPIRSKIIKELMI